MKFPAEGCALALLLICTLVATTAKAEPSETARDGVSRLKTISAVPGNVSIDSATELVSFVRLDGASPQLQPSLGRVAGQSFDIQTRNFLADYGPAFGLHHPSQDLQLVREQVGSHGAGQARYRQVYQGVPVFGAQLVSQFDRNQQLSAIAASTIEVDLLDINPSWLSEQAEHIARQAVIRDQPLSKPALDIQAIHTELMVYHSGLLQGVPGRNHLAWRVEVADGALTLRQFVFVDAHSGKVLNRINGIHTVLDRKVSETSLGNVKWQDSNMDPDPIPVAWAGGNVAQVKAWQDEIDGARETYNLIASMTAGNWLSYDGADAIMRTINNNPSINCPNASWNGTSTNFCNNVTGDDTVAHEWGHAYTQYTADLIYQWQAGALNESFSDIWGEVVDFLNGRGTDAPNTARTDGSCSVYGNGPNIDDSYRWLSAEDNPALGGAIRDMWTPTCYNDPGKVSDNQYRCGRSDGGGVHTNSGVPNHAFALAVDGGSYNGQVINGIGLTKASHVFWNALQILVPASDFAQLADALEANCSNLTGIDLPQLSTSQISAGLSGETINAGDCAQLAKAITAVELRSPPSQCNFQPLLQTNPPARCLNAGELQSISLTDWESGLGAWTASRHDVVKPATFDTHDWAAVANLPGNRPGSAAFVADLIIGDCDADDESGALALDSPIILIPENIIVPRLSLNHWLATEFEYDGGNLKVSVNGGAFTLIPAAALEVSPYNASLKSEFAGNTNPLAGQPAFTGSDAGSLSGSWGQTRVNLSGIAAGGDSIRLRLDFGIDGCNGLVGWYVDEVEFYSCAAENVPEIIFEDGFEDKP